MKHKMRSALDSISRTMVMAAIVTTLLCLPVGALLAWLAYAVLEIPFQSFLTFAGTFNRFQGLVAWWAVLFVPAFAYAASVLPWSATEIL